MAGRTTSAASVAPPPTPAIPKELMATMATEGDEAEAQGIDAHGGGDHDREHGGVGAGAAVLPDGGAEGG